MVRFILSLILVMLLLGCSPKETEYHSIHEDAIRESFLAKQDENKPLPTKSQEEADENAIITPFLPFSK